MPPAPLPLLFTRSTGQRCVQQVPLTVFGILILVSTSQVEIPVAQRIRITNGCEPGSVAEEKINLDKELD